MLFLGPTLLSGIGQLMKKYCDLMNGQYVQLGEHFPPDQEVFVFALPIPQWLDNIPLVQKHSKKVLCMTICETETVHPAYGKLFDMFEVVFTPSVFCQRVFQTQFPGTKFEIIRSAVPVMKTPKKKIFTFPDDVYIFYHIGNVLDQRKNVKKIIEAFLRLNLPKSLLVLKATCHTAVEWKAPNVHVINGLLPDEAIRDLHDQVWCLIVFS
jgi:hypothetical protein